MTAPTAIVTLRPAPPDLCLAFVNTRRWRGQAKPDETLHSPEQLLAWCREHAGVPARLADALAEAWQHDPFVARAAFDRAIALRETLNRLFGTRMQGAAPLGGDLTTLEAALSASPARTRLEPTDDGLAWRVKAPADLWLLLAPVLWSASDLLAGPQGAKVRRCTNPDCQLLFLDTSRAGNRLWCSMRRCGNRAKARRHYQRVRQFQPS